jgi:hypothetical protein
VYDRWSGVECVRVEVGERDGEDRKGREGEGFEERRAGRARWESERWKRLGIVERPK